ncbi:NUDIX domain-containing protein [Actinomadura fibrosa]|uniref:NUDIX domain-containing protein n=1 Tax=Actinomadura fibrosa TaxID=111802 RepID=A0ABW2XNQ4_9ACTN|nr:NUDIX hydrolase [Actinomadura fibrosa]
MKLDVEVPGDGRRHQYCWGCRAETVTAVDGAAGFRCATCGEEYPRTLAVDPALTWWVDGTGEYWHATAGVFVRRADGRFLLFERVYFPLRWTVPAGHIDAGEDPRHAARRELGEEVGLLVDEADLVLVGVDEMPGDSCWRGSDAHRWHTYVVDVPAGTTVQVLEEGRRPAWLTPSEALGRPLTVPVRALIERYGNTGLRM